MSCVIRWIEKEEGTTRQCATSPFGDYDTLCGLALYELEQEDHAGIKVIEERKGRVTCSQCKKIIDHVKEYY